jgi:hypothetical protein
MNIIINGEITEMPEPRMGVSKKNGNKWIHQTVIVNDKEKTRYAINIIAGENHFKKLNLKVGDFASFACDMQSSEWQERWFTSLTIKDVDDIIVKRVNTTQNTQDTFYNINEDDKVDVNTLPF